MQFLERKVKNLNEFSLLYKQKKKAGWYPAKWTKLVGIGFRRNGKRNRPAYYAGEKKKDNKIKNEKERKNRDLLSTKLGGYKYGMDIELLVFLEFGGEDEAVGDG